MASVSGATSSLGNTSLRGFGGLASGIDRDEMIEAMTSGTQSKIDSQKSDMTKLQWKQEAYRSVIDKIIDMEDEYLSYVSGSNLKSYGLFAKSIIDVIGDSDVTKFIKASGTSSWVDNLAIQAVDNLATAATRMSGNDMGVGSIETGITDLEQNVKVSSLSGRQLILGTTGYKDSKEIFNSVATFTFPTTYTEEGANGEKVTRDIDYTTTNFEELKRQLNLAAKDFKVGENGHLAFDYDGTIMQVKVLDKEGNEITDPAYKIASRSSAFEALGFNKEALSEAEQNGGVALNAATKSFGSTYVKEITMQKYLTGQKLTFSYGGQTKTIDLLKEDDNVTSMDDLRDRLQERLDKAFGRGKVTVALNPVDAVDSSKGQRLSFKAEPDSEGNTQTLTVNSSNAELRKIIGIEKNASNKLNVDASLWSNRGEFGFNSYTDDADGKAEFQKDLQDFTINGIKIKGITADTTVNELIDLINSNTNKEAGVKASYLSGSNQLLLVATDTGAGRQITFGKEIVGADGKPQGDGGIAAKIFGGGESKDGEDAKILVSYGNGVSQTLTSSTNTFDLEGMKVTVSGEFGYKTNESGDKKVLDTSQTVTFSAKADAEKTTETVKKFFEAFNAMVDEVNGHVTTRPDSAYGPLTDAQKEEMDEKSIENWETKAKQGILFGDTSMNDFSVALQRVMVNLMNSGISYSDLKEIGIEMSDNEKDGGRILFDESKFKAAMENDPEMVSNIFTGGGDVKKGLAYVIEDTLTPYATRYRSDNAATSGAAGSYGRLVEEAGSEKMPMSVSKNWINTQLKEMEKTINTLKSRLKTEQDRYIKQFTTMESMINKFNTQAGYLSQFQG